MRSICILVIYVFFPIICFGQELKPKESSLGITISLPWANNYIYFDHDLSETKHKSGFFGLGAAFYYKKNESKYSLNIGLTGDLPAPIGPIDFAQEGKRSVIGCYFAEGLYHRKILPRVNIVSGINFLTYRYVLWSYIDSLPTYIKEDVTIGITVGPEYRSKKSFALAMLWRPALIGIGTKGYKHQISLDARFDISFKKR